MVEKAHDDDKSHGNDFRPNGNPETETDPF